MKKGFKELKHYLYSGTLISFGIAVSVASVIRIVLLNESPLTALGIFGGGLIIGIGLIPFKMRKELR